MVSALKRHDTPPYNIEKCFLAETVVSSVGQAEIGTPMHDLSILLGQIRSIRTIPGIILEQFQPEISQAPGCNIGSRAFLRRARL